MITITLDLNSMTAAQIAALDAALKHLPVPSKTKNEITEAGEANCGRERYDRIYTTTLVAMESAVEHADKWDAINLFLRNGGALEFDADDEGVNAYAHRSGAAADLDSANGESNFYDALETIGGIIALEQNSLTMRIIK
jgi:hypothetical protein